MEIALHIILFALGFVLIIKGSDWFIDATVFFAKKFRIPHMIIGATLVSICTTLPETFVSVTASIKGETDMAIGNAIGSIAVNTGFVLAILILFAKPFVENKREFAKNGIFLIFLLLFLITICLTTGVIDSRIGLFLCALLVLYLISNVISAMRSKESSDVSHTEDHISPAMQVVFFLVGITMVVYGSNLIVEHGIIIAEILKVPTIVIALVFVGFGTSLPELVTVITSIRKGATSLGIGNIIGANILNIVQVISISALINPIVVGDEKLLKYIQMPLTALIVISVIWFGLFNKNGFKRSNGVFLFALYALFVIITIFGENIPLVDLLIYSRI